MPYILVVALAMHILNLAAAPPAVVRTAADDAVHLFATIGVPIDAADMNGRDDSATIRVVLVPDPTGELRKARNTVFGATVWTVKGTPVVYVFYRRVQAEADRYRIPVAQVLACTLAHELGH